MASRRFIWYDFETWGLDPCITPVASFATIITDENLCEQVRYEQFVRPLKDRVLSPTSACITQLNPTELAQESMGEHQFAQWLHALLNQSTPTTIIGFNNSHYDNKLLRFLFFRNLLPAYQHEQSPHATLDALDMLRLAHALRPQGIVWPQAQGAPTFRLENLAAANGIEHQAHAAIGDVEATLALIRLLKNAQPALYTHLVQQHTLADLQRMSSANRLLLYVDKYAGHKHKYITPVALLASPFGDKHRIAIDMRCDYSAYIECDSATLAQALSKDTTTQAASMAESVQTNVLPASPQLHVFSVNLKQAAVFAPLSVLHETNCAELNLNPDALHKKYTLLHENGFLLRLANAWQLRTTTYNKQQTHDLDASLYQAFVPYQQQAYMDALVAALHKGEPHQMHLDALTNPWRALTQQYMYRHYPEVLTDFEQHAWQAYVRARDANVYQQYVQEQTTMANLCHDEKLRNLLTQVRTHNQATRQTVFSANK